ncbi:class I SAM-dependent methyltransferase [Barrientosiimonas marina]|uniref:Class I SAM-dependent methyltransferase n=1 Tax=Lentibacillus kimchii TaxID=1542911 RepID=A0ABW2URX4_9BACI
MSDHYFSQHPHSKSSPKKWHSRLLGSYFTFESDYGVFSKNEVDYGSRLLVEQFAEPAIAGDFLDLGCGYGPIGIAVAAHHPNRHISLSDINERATALARKNADHNHVSNTDVVLSDGFHNLNGRAFAAILTNPPIRAGKQTVHQMFEDSHDALLKGGCLWVVIQKKQGAPSAQKKLINIFGNVTITDRSKGYYILQAIK